MRTIAIFSLKGGVGKTTVAVNLAYAAATVGARRTLVWDLDAQGAASFILGDDGQGRGSARKRLAPGAQPLDDARPTKIPGLHLLAADKSLRHLERQLLDDRGRPVLARLLAGLAPRFDRLILDCPPGFSALAEQIFAAAELIVEPVPPAPLAERAHTALGAHLGKHHAGTPAVLPVFSGVDARRGLHRSALAAHPGRLALPTASVVERMGVERKPLGAIAPGSAAARAYGELWAATERHLLSADALPVASA